MFLPWWPAALAVGYTAAFVAEYEAVTVSGNANDTMWRNVAAAAAFAAEAAAAGADVLVLPEYGITGFVQGGKFAWEDFVVVIPDGVMKQVACGDETVSPYIAALSCAARDAGVALVVDLAERWQGYHFNTALCFDTEGRLVARSRKYNLWDEPAFDVPSTCNGPQAFRISPSIDIEFGLFVCADVVYNFPGDALLRQGVTDFLAPLAWPNVMPQTEPLSFIQGWSAARCVNIVFANHRQPMESGSGAFSCGRRLVAYYATGPALPGPVVVVVNMTPASPLPPPPVVAASSQHGPTTAAVPLNPAGVPTTLCHNACCCTASVQGNASGYVLAASNGADTGSGVTWGVLSCGVYYGSPDQYSRPLAAGVVCAVVSMTAKDLPAALMLPSTLFTYEGVADTMVPPSSAENVIASNNTASLTVEAPRGMSVASTALYGRVFSRDRVPYNCS